MPWWAVKPRPLRTYVALGSGSREMSQRVSRESDNDFLCRSTYPTTVGNTHLPRCQLRMSQDLRAKKRRVRHSASDEDSGVTSAVLDDEAAPSKKVRWSHEGEETTSEENEEKTLESLEPSERKACTTHGNTVQILLLGIR